MDMGFGDGNRRSNIEAFAIEVGKHLAHHRTKRIQGDDVVRLAPTGMRPDGFGWSRIGKIGTVARFQSATGHGERPIDGIRPRVRANGIAISRLRQCGNHWSTLHRISMAPLDRHGLWAKFPWVGCQHDMFLTCGPSLHCYTLHGRKPLLLHSDAITHSCCLLTPLVVLQPEAKSVPWRTPGERALQEPYVYV